MCRQQKGSVMSTVLLITTLAIFTTMTLALIRAIMGPTVYDRIVAVNMFGTKTVLAVALIVFITGHSDLLDVALVYALINFISVITILKLSHKGNLAAAGKRERGSSDDCCHHQCSVLVHAAGRRPGGHCWRAGAAALSGHLHPHARCRHDRHPVHAAYHCRTHAPGRAEHADPQAPCHFAVHAVYIANVGPRAGQGGLDGRR